MTALGCIVFLAVLAMFFVYEVFNYGDDQGGLFSNPMVVMMAIYACPCVAVLVVLAVEIACLVFVYKDAQARGAEPMLWMVIVFFTHFTGLIVWLCVRPPLQAHSAEVFPRRRG
jgi:magnesium-transporting ATPase (P-type)